MLRSKIQHTVRSLEIVWKKPEYVAFEACLRATTFFSHLESFKLSSTLREHSMWLPLNALAPHKWLKILSVKLRHCIIAVFMDYRLDERWPNLETLELVESNYNRHPLLPEVKLEKIPRGLRTLKLISESRLCTGIQDLALLPTALESLEINFRIRDPLKTNEWEWIDLSHLTRLCSVFLGNSTSETTLDISSLPPSLTSLHCNSPALAKSENFSWRKNLPNISILRLLNATRPCSIDINDIVRGPVVTETSTSDDGVAQSLNFFNKFDSLNASPPRTSETANPLPKGMKKLTLYTVTGFSALMNALDTEYGDLYSVDPEAASNSLDSFDIISMVDISYPNSSWLKPFPRLESLPEEEDDYYDNASKTLCTSNPVSISTLPIGLMRLKAPSVEYDRKDRMFPPTLTKISFDNYLFRSADIKLLPSGLTTLQGCLADDNTWKTLATHPFPQLKTIKELPTYPTALAHASHIPKTVTKLSICLSCPPTGDNISQNPHPWWEKVPKNATNVSFDQATLSSGVEYEDGFHSHSNMKTLLLGFFPVPVRFLECLPQNLTSLSVLSLAQPVESINTTRSLPRSLVSFSISDYSCHPREDRVPVISNEALLGLPQCLSQLNVPHHYSQSNIERPSVSSFPPHLNELTGFDVVHYFERYDPERPILRSESALAQSIALGNFEKCQKELQKASGEEK